MKDILAHKRLTEVIDYNPDTGILTCKVEDIAPPKPEPIDFTPPWRYYVVASDHELQRLLDIVRKAYPMLVPDVGLEPFKVAFTYVGTLGRLERIDRGHGRQTDRSRVCFDAATWGDRCEAWCRQHYAPCQDTARMVFAAVVAWGDVPFQLPGPGWPHIYYGLHEHLGVKAGHALVTSPSGAHTHVVEVGYAWRDILKPPHRLRTPDPLPELPSGVIIGQQMMRPAYVGE